MRKQSSQMLPRRSMLLLPVELAGRQAAVESAVQRAAQAERRRAVEAAAQRVPAERQAAAGELARAPQVA